MKISPIIKYTPENFSILLRYFEDSIRSISSYDDLDENEKSIISRKKFEEFTKFTINETKRDKRE